MTFKNSAQGTIEYLVILAVIVVISLVVVSLMISSTAPSESISEQQSKIFWRAQTIAIFDFTVDSNGDAIISIDSTVTGILDKFVIDGVDYDAGQMALNTGGSYVFYATGLNPCIGANGYYSVNIHSVSQFGLSQVVKGEIDFVAVCSENVEETNIVANHYRILTS